jgi:Flp pilus assembly pilin Flp
VLRFRTPFLRGRRGAGVVEYAILIFLLIVAAFAAWRYLGGSVKGSTDSAQGKFSGGGGSGQTAAAGGDNQSSGGGGSKQGGTAGKAGGGGGGGGGAERSGTPGEAKVAHVAKPGEGGTVADNRASASRAAQAEGTAPKKSNWFKYAMIALLIVGLMAAVYTFGKKKSAA